MRVLEIDLAGGGDVSIDPRVAPQGTITRAVNVRLDRKGRLVARSGYTSLGLTIHNTLNTLIPRDLIGQENGLLALGRHSSTQQNGIRGIYQYNPSVKGVWRTANNFSNSTDLNTTTTFLPMPVASQLEVLTSEPNSALSDALNADAAITDDGAYALVVYAEFATNQTSARIIRMSDGSLHHFETFGDELPRVMAIGSVFYLFSVNNVGQTLRVRTFDTATTFTFWATAINLAATIPARTPFDVAPVVGSTDYVIVVATNTGYSHGRFTSVPGVHAPVYALTAVASTANAACSICASAADTISILNADANLCAIRQFNVATGALIIGPTNVFGVVNTWDRVIVQRRNTTTVLAIATTTMTVNGVPSIPCTFTAIVTTATNNSAGIRSHRDCVAVSKPVYAGPSTSPALDPAMTWEIVDTGGGNATWVLMELGDSLGITACPQAHVFDGAARDLQQNINTKFPLMSASMSTSGVMVGALVTKDPRDKSYRANLVSVKLFSDDRVQSALMNAQQYLAGGFAMQYDGIVPVDVGLLVAPTIALISQSTTGLPGGMTLLGTYTYYAIARSVAQNGEVTQSSPSDPVTVTLTGVNNQVTLQVRGVLTFRKNAFGAAQQLDVVIDVYATEANGTIPRRVANVTVPSFSLELNNMSLQVNIAVTDAVQQTGAPMYTQGADGAISGRLPLGSPAACKFIVERGGRLLLGGLERPNELQLSIEQRPGESMGFVNDDLFFVTNPDRVTGLAVGPDGRTFVFSATQTRELVGDGPNAAGSDATLVDPIMLEPTLGCVDWRSICVTELGVFFQSSQAPDPKIYLRPNGGGQAILVSDGIRDTLRDFPIITSATRHEQDQLLTFTLQNSAGTDGRIIHMDLQSSGMGRSGWVGKWFVDRVPQLEGAPDIEIVEEQEYLFPQVLNASLSVPLPAGRRIGDRILIFAFVFGNAAPAAASPASFTQIGTVVCDAASRMRVSVYEQVVTSSAFQTTTFTTHNPLNGGPTLGSVAYRVVLLRGSNLASAGEVVTQTSGAGSSSSLALPILSPSWGTANTLYYSVVGNTSSFLNNLAKIWRAPPSGFDRIDERFMAETFTQTHASGSRLVNAASLSGVTWSSAFSLACAALLVAIRPLAAAGTPVRSSASLGGRLVVCNDSDVVLSDATSIADFGSAFIVPEIELADLYPMGPGGAGRHLAIVFLGELLGFCVLNCYVSYDEGRNWQALRSFQLNTTTGYSIGQTLRLTWVPKRRKITGVRVKFTVTENTIDLPLPGDTLGIAMHRVFMQFDELIGPSRLENGKRQ